MQSYKTIKVLEDNIGENLKYLAFGNDFIDKITKAWFLKEKIDKLNFIKIKMFCFAKDNVKTMKRQATDWKEIF